MNVTPPIRDYSDRVLLTFHGIASDNAGFGRLREHCKTKLPGLVFEPGYCADLRPWKNLDEEVARLAFRAVGLTIRDVYNKYNRKLFIVAHSFGTLAVVRAFEEGIAPAKVEGLVLLGSIVRTDQSWGGYVDNGTLQNAPLAIVRPWDFVVRLAGRVGGQPSGARGFVPNRAPVPVQSYKGRGHRGYDPDDFEDIATLVADGLQAVAVVSERDWRSQRGRLKRFCLFLYDPLAWLTEKILWVLEKARLLWWLWFIVAVALGLIALVIWYVVATI